MPRLFSGLELPSDVRAQLASLKAPLPGVRWIEEENLHLTLRFFGDVNNSAAHEIVHALTAEAATLVNPNRRGRRQRKTPVRPHS